MDHAYSYTRGNEFYDKFNSSKFSKVRKEVVSWIRFGYLLAQRMYGKDQQQNVGITWRKLHDKVVADHNNYHPTFGDKIRVSIDTKTLETKVERV
jgi:hypothetical protein